MSDGGWFSPGGLPLWQPLLDIVKGCRAMLSPEPARDHQCILKQTHLVILLWFWAAWVWLLEPKQSV